MSHINAALSHSDVRETVWVTLGLKKNLVLPSFPSEVLYGRLSEMLHQPKFLSILISNKVDSDYKHFFTSVVEKYDLLVEVYSEEEAAAGEEIMRKNSEL